MTDQPMSTQGQVSTAPFRRRGPSIARAAEAFRAQVLHMSAMDRWNRIGQFQGWLQQSSLQHLTLEQAQVLYSASGGRKGKEFKSNSPEEVRDSIDFLLYDPLSLDGRFSECVDPEGAYTLKGCGKSFVSYLLCVRYPQLFGHWSSYSDKSLSMLGTARPKARKMAQGQGTTYVQYLDVLWSVRKAAGMADFPELDRFLWWLSREGKARSPSENGRDPESKIHRN